MSRHNTKPAENKDNDDGKNRRVLHRRFNKKPGEQSDKPQSDQKTTTEEEGGGDFKEDKAKTELKEKINAVAIECDMLKDENKRLTDLLKTKYNSTTN